MRTIAILNAKEQFLLKYPNEEFEAPETEVMQSALKAQGMGNFNLTKTIELRLSGIDVMHLSERKQTTGIIDSYYSVSSRVWYMPGSILIGALLKYSM